MPWGKPKPWKWFDRRCARCGEGRRASLVEETKAGMMVYSCGHLAFYRIDAAPATL